jgi:hypothetical protein
MNISRQVETLRTITSHSDFVHFLNPYIGGGDGRKREIDFAISLIQAVHRRPIALVPNPIVVLLLLSSYRRCSFFNGGMALRARW